jgi:hypothetical protein
MTKRRRACRGANRRTEAARDERAGRGRTLGDLIPTDLATSLFPTSMVWMDPRHGAGAPYTDGEGLLGQRPRRLPWRRAGYERRPPSGARPRRFEGPAWGTHEFRGRGAPGVAVIRLRQTAGGCRPCKAVGCSLWADTGRESRGAVEQRSSGSSGCNDRGDRKNLLRRGSVY